MIQKMKVFEYEGNIKTIQETNFIILRDEKVGLNFLFIKKKNNT